ncbi:hypothetical protein DERP_004286 [Dermatophagoides pteronyssinus]|uniref:Uncharacterized protein n=1 Tax=Dermatophagoides pteronyssinus TaxID=6956 RepID=A0ABQ8JNC0_DERPT|nr:hypothetical protein DERP_004286 [Dermatophagoides pteronyssinus]
MATTKIDLHNITEYNSFKFRSSFDSFFLSNDFFSYLTESKNNYHKLICNSFIGHFENRLRLSNIYG